MATLSELVATVAAVEGIEPATVRLIARNIREAGLIATGGRGASAATMSPRDACNLIIAVNASGVIREAVQIVRSFRKLEIDEKEDGRPRRNFGGALETLIEGAINRSLPFYLGVKVPNNISEAFGNDAIEVEITFRRPKPEAHIFLSGPENMGPYINLSAHDPEVLRTVERFKLALKFEFGLPGEKRQQPMRRYHGDRRDEVTISYATIRAVGEILRQKEFDSEESGR